MRKITSVVLFLFIFVPCYMAKKEQICESIVKVYKDSRRQELKLKGRNAAARTGGLGEAKGFKAITYNTIKISPTCIIRGQRDPSIRHKLLEYNYTGKTWLDIGANSGGIIFSAITMGLIPKRAIGLDYDRVMVETARNVSVLLNVSKVVEFHRANVLKGDHEHHKDHYDVISLFSINMWVSNFLEVASWAAEHADTVIMELNGDIALMLNTVQKLNNICAKLEDKTDDDHTTCPRSDCQSRRLYICIPKPLSEIQALMPLQTKTRIERSPSIQEKKGHFSTNLFKTQKQESNIFDDLQNLMKLRKEVASLDDSEPTKASRLKTYDGLIQKLEAILQKKY
eukprot:m.98467 g.98467  ORF g.98467 m.98467 type:complete len:340 (+) comp13638_c0_seq1:841-1860(+)